MSFTSLMFPIIFIINISHSWAQKLGWPSWLVREGRGTLTFLLCDYGRGFTLYYDLQPVSWRGGLSEREKKIFLGHVLHLKGKFNLFFT